MVCPTLILDGRDPAKNGEWVWRECEDIAQKIIWSWDMASLTAKGKRGPGLFIFLWHSDISRFWLWTEWWSLLRSCPSFLFQLLTWSGLLEIRFPTSIFQGCVQKMLDMLNDAHFFRGTHTMARWWTLYPLILWKKENSKFYLNRGLAFQLYIFVSHVSMWHINSIIIITSMFSPKGSGRPSANVPVYAHF